MERYRAGKEEGADNSCGENGKSGKGGGGERKKRRMNGMRRLWVPCSKRSSGIRSSIATPPLRGAKLSAVLESVRRDEDRIRRVNFTDRGLFTITGGYDVKGLKKAIA